MDTRTQLNAQRERLEAELLALEQEPLHSMPEDGARIFSLLSSLGLVNAELAAIRQGDELGPERA